MNGASKARGRRAGATVAVEPAVSDAYALLKDELLSGAFAAGTPLREVALASRFGVSRERVRKALHRLGAEQLVELVPNRGAFVPRPDLGSTAEAYAARRVLEGGLVLTLADVLTPSRAQRLQAHLAAEREAARRGDRAAAVRLSGQFHRLLAELGGNALVARYMDELVARTTMVVALHEHATPRCGLHEHEEIAEALFAGDGPRAARVMAGHLALIETRLRIVDEPASAAATAPRALRVGLGPRVDHEFPTRPTGATT